MERDTYIYIYIYIMNDSCLSVCCIIVLFSQSAPPPQVHDVG